MEISTFDRRQCVSFLANPGCLRESQAPPESKFQERLRGGLAMLVEGTACVGGAEDDAACVDCPTPVWLVCGSERVEGLPVLLTPEARRALLNRAAISTSSSLTAFPGLVDVFWWLR
jgi:hypothetical protein